MTLLSLPEGRPVTKMSNLLDILQHRYGVSVPSATKVRKQVATLECSSDEIALLSRQMSHSIETHRKHYEQIGTSQHAAKAHSITKKLVEKKKVRQRFSTSEITDIKEFFENEIREGSSSAGSSCWNIQMDRDRVRVGFSTKLCHGVLN